MFDSVGVAIIGIVLSTAVIWAGSIWLEGASANLATYYDLPPVVQGGIIAAAGSSFPEFASVVLSALAGSFDLGVGAVVGSAVFNLLVIPALAVILTPGNLDTTRTLVHKETLFYILSVSVLFLTFALSIVYFPEAAELTGKVTRGLVLIPLGVYGLYLFLQWQDSVDLSAQTEIGSVSVAREWLLLLAGLVFILGGVFVLVEGVLTLGDEFGVSDFLWGATIVAAATSVPDALVSVQAADRGREVASIANVVGSNTFDLLVVIPAGILIVGAETVDFAVTAPMMGALVGATLVLFITMRTGLVLTNREAYLLLGTYFIFLLWIIAEATNRVTFLST